MVIPSNRWLFCCCLLPLSNPAMGFLSLISFLFFFAFLFGLLRRLPTPPCLSPKEG